MAGAVDVAPGPSLARSQTGRQSRDGGESRGSPTPGSRLLGAHTFPCKVIEVGKSVELDVGDVWRRAGWHGAQGRGGQVWHAAQRGTWRTVGTLQVTVAVPSVNPDEEGRGWVLIPVVGSVPRFPHLSSAAMRAPGRAGARPGRGSVRCTARAV